MNDNSQDRKTRIKGDRVIHTVKGKFTPGGVEGGEVPRGLTAEQWEEQRTGHKLDERQVREAAHDGLSGKQQVERLGGTDDVTSVKKGRG